MTSSQRRSVSAAFTILALTVARPALATTFSGCPQTCTPTLSAPNGNVAHPEIAYTFWEGPAPNNVWTTNTNVVSRGQIIGAMLSLVNNAQYWAEIAPGYIAPPRVAPYATIFTGSVNGHNPTSQGFQLADVGQIINTQISNGRLPPPQPNDDSIYVVVVPNGASDGFGEFCAGAEGCNFGVANTNFNGVPYSAVYADVSWVISHEVAESIASYVGIGVTNNCGGNQIADPCQCHTESYNGQTVQAYYSSDVNGCVIPERWGNLWENSNGWFETSGAFELRQAAGGAGGVVATDATETSSGNAVHFYNGQTWSQIGTGGAQFAAGGGIIARIALDDSEIDYYVLSTGQWHSAGAPASTVTGISVTSGGLIFATDEFSFPYFYDPTNPGWHAIDGNPGDQFIAGGSSIYQLSSSHTQLLSWSGAGAFVVVGNVSPATAILANPDSGFVAVTVAGQAAYTFGGTTITNTLQGGATQFAGIPLFEFINGVGSNGSYELFECQSEGCTGTGGPGDTFGLGGLVISGNNMFLTGCDSNVLPCVVD